MKRWGKGTVIVAGLVTLGIILLLIPHIAWEMAVSTMIHPVWALYVSIGWFGQLVTRVFSNWVAAAVLYLVLPRVVEQLAHQIEKDPLRTALVGFVASVLWIVCIVVMALMIIGIPLALLLTIAGVAVALGANGTIIWMIGSRVYGDRPRIENSGLMILAGGFLLSLVEMTPVVGMAVQFLVWILGVGALVGSMRKTA